MGRMLTGDVIKMLKRVPDASVHCVVTSPPYWGLRDYGTGQWEGGDAGCDHSVGGQVQDTKAKGAITTGVRPGCDASVCRKCGARRVDRQIGLEPTPDAYVARMVEVFAEVWRVLRDDGTCWVNIGDSYNGVGGQGKQNGGPIGPTAAKGGVSGKHVPGLKMKDLCLIPFRLALALQEFGWTVRSDIIWAKKATMPESVRDRPTMAHEHVFLLAKGPKYFYDQEAERVGLVDCNAQRTTTHYNTAGRGPKDGGNDGLDKLAARMRDGSASGRNLWSYWLLDGSRYGAELCKSCGKAYIRKEYNRLQRDNNKKRICDKCGKVDWVSHFATFPKQLPKICINLGTSVRGACSECGAPWERVVGRKANTPGQAPGYTRDCSLRNDGDRAGCWTDGVNTTLGWQPTCDCYGIEKIEKQPRDKKKLKKWRRRAKKLMRKYAKLRIVPCTVLDPFGGLGTTCLEAERMGRNWIYVDINKSYKYMFKHILKHERMNDEN